MKTRLGGRTWAALLTFGLFGQIAWVIENMYFNVFLYNTISGDTSMIAAMVAWSAVTATVSPSPLSTTLTIPMMASADRKLDAARSNRVVPMVSPSCSGWSAKFFTITLLMPRVQSEAKNEAYAAA